MVGDHNFGLEILVGGVGDRKPRPFLQAKGQPVDLQVQREPVDLQVQREPVDLQVQSEPVDLQVLREL